MPIAPALPLALALAAAPIERRADTQDAVPWTGEDERETAAAPATASAPARDPTPVPVQPPARGRTVSKLVPKREPARMAERPLGRGAKVVFKPGAGISFGTADEKFTLGINLWGQLLYTYLHRDPKPNGEDADTQSFQVRRARVIFQGNAFSRHFKYHIHFQVAPRDLGLTHTGGTTTVAQSPLFMWWVQYDRLRDLTPQAGMFFVPFSRQRFTQPARLQFVDNSIAAFEFGFDRDIGLVLKSKDVAGLGGRLRYQAGLFMGEGYEFQVQRDFGMQYVGRVEVLPFGDFEDVNESDFVRATKPKLVLGGAYSFVDNDARNRPLGPAPVDGGTTDTHNVVVDVVLKAAGFSFLGDFFWRKGRRTPGNATLDDGMGGTAPAPVEPARDGIGWTAQAAFLIPRVPFEIGGRYAGIRRPGTAPTITTPTGTTVPVLDDIDEVGPGVSYYFAQHALKLQLDYFHQFGPGESRSDRIRLQLTFIF
jgi:hypothetical protein